MVCGVESGEQRRQVAVLLNHYGLHYEEGADDLLGIWDGGGRLLATGARQGSLLKMLAVADDQGGGALLSEVVSELIRRGYEQGLETFFIITKPQHAHSFAAINFRLLCLTDQVALLEHGPGLPAYLKHYRCLRRDGENGAVVINGNPFTLGHRHLVETAAQQLDWLYLFVVEEDSSSFPFEVRFELIRRAVADLDNVLVLPSGPYAVSRITFPGYFLKDAQQVERQQHQVDAQLFCQQLAPAFAIRHRFVGQEPYCAVTRRYNRALSQQLPPQGIVLHEIPRMAVDGSAVSASRVRHQLQQRTFHGLAQLVPDTTLDYLQSDACQQAVRWNTLSGRH